jgi:glycosyltransferase involved in cell wall biosynthesis
MPMRVSVALCTYNGERYISEQLVSFLEQTRRPDELVVCDDHSVDRTLTIVREFAQRASFPVKIFANECTLGSSKNFERAIALCEGDIIVLSDQDDVWIPEKLAAIENLFLMYSDTHVVFSDAEIVDESLQAMGYRLWDSINFSSWERREVADGRAMRVFLRHNVVTGATLAFRTSLRAFTLPVPAEGVHDAWIALIGAATGRVRLLSQPLIRYRQHSSNQIGAKRRSIIARMKRPGTNRICESMDVLSQYEQAIERLRRVSTLGNSAELLREFTNKAEHVRNRISVQVRGHGWLKLMLSEIVHGRYHRYSVGWWSVGNDLLGGSLDS